jgi:cyclohexanone monooxygenase
MTTGEGMTGEGTDLDVVVVGAGFAGLYMLHRARGAGLRVRCFEAAGGVGGVWYWNRYPGARCDVESLEYSYSFDEALQQEWRWPERYSSQPQILEYLDHVCDRFDLRGSIRFDTRVTAAHYDEASAAWRVRTDRGEDLTTGFLVMATGCLSATNTPAIPGLERFTGEVFHTARWPHRRVPFAGQRVAVVGTGSSGVQVIPEIAGEAAHLYVFQRTAGYSMPSGNGLLDPDEEAEIKADYRAFREANRLAPAGLGSRDPVRPVKVLEDDPTERERAFEASWRRGGFAFLRTYRDITLDRDANRIAADFARAKIRAIVKDPATADLLSPKIVIGCKRPIIDCGYYETFNRANVTLVDVGTTPVAEIMPRSLRVADRDYEVDSIVFATGFDAMTGSILRVDVRGRDGRPLADAWSAGPATYLGLSVAGFPNLFTITGPGSPSVLTNMVVAIEQHVDWVTDCIAHLQARGCRSIEATPDAQAAWVAHVNDVAAGTLYNDPSCNSWYLGSNIPGKKRMFMPLIGFPPYVEKCDEVAASGYEGFAIA